MHNLYNIINSGRQQQRTTGGSRREGRVEEAGPAGSCCCFLLLLLCLNLQVPAPLAVVLLINSVVRCSN